MRSPGSPYAFDKPLVTIDDAVEFAMNAPDPDPADAVTDLYA